jgi:hypothetical protein
MMKALGNFRGTIVDAGIDVTSGGFPQFVAKLHVDEMYDEEAKEWAVWEDFGWEGNEGDMRDIVSYNILMGQKGATRSHEQVVKITGWAGDSFAALAAMDCVGMQIQWRNEENTYQEKTSVQVSWIDVYDAEPGGTVRKLDAKGIKDLDAKYKAFMPNAAKPEKAASSGKRGTKKPATAPVEEPATEETKADAPATTKPKTTTTKPGRPKGGAKKKPDAPAVDPTKDAKRLAKSSAPPAPEEKPATTEPPAGGEEEETPFDTGGPCTKNEAWDDICELKKEDVTDSELAKVWLEQIELVAPGVAQDEITQEQWGSVRAAVLDLTAVF